MLSAIARSLVTLVSYDFEFRRLPPLTSSFYILGWKLCSGVTIFMQVSQASCCAQDLQSRCDFFDPSPSVPIHRFPVVSSFIHQFSQSCWKWFWIFPKVNPHIHILPFEESSTIWGICFGNVVGISWGPPAHLRVTGARIYWWGTLTNRLCPSWCAPTRWMLVGTERCALAAKKIGHICVGKGWNMLEIPSLFKGRSWTSSNYGFSSLMLQCWEYGMFQTYIYICFSHIHGDG